LWLAHMLTRFDAGRVDLPAMKTNYFPVQK